MAMTPAVVIVFLVVLGFLAYQGFSHQMGAMDDIYGNRFVGFQECSKVVADVNGIHKNVYKLLSWISTNHDEKVVDALAKEQTSALEKTMKALEGLAKKDSLAPEEKKILEASLGQMKGYREDIGKVIDMASADYNMGTVLMKGADGKFQALSKSLGDLMALETKLSEEQYRASAESFRGTLRNFLIVGVVAVLLSIGSTFALTRLLSSRIHETVQVIEQVAEGDLTREMNASSEDELGQLARSVNAMRVKMGEAVGQSKEISQHLSESASEQAATLEQTAASLDELESMTRQNAGNTEEANRLMASANEVMDKANRSMVQLAASTQQIAEASRKTQNIVKSIDEIAFQTNLLALNAAVEAARAGEAGAGFAVVANEVRNLALRATDSARSTSELIEDIVRKVRDGEHLAQATRGDFDEVIAAAAKVVALMAEIAAASKEQSEGIGQINRAVAEMNQVTQKNAAAAQELSSTMSMFRTEGRAVEEPAPGFAGQA